MTTVVIRRPDGQDDELLGNNIEVDQNGTLLVYNDEVSSKTTTTLSPRFFGVSDTITTTEVTRKRYISASYPVGHWTSAYAKTTKVEEETKVNREPYN